MQPNETNNQRDQDNQDYLNGICPHVKDPHEECYCYEISSQQNIRESLYYCAKRYKECKLYQRFLVKEDEKVPKVLVVDDEESIRLVCKEFLTKAGYEVSVAEREIDAKEILSANKFDVAVVDQILPNGQRGIDLLKEIKRSQPSCAVIMMSGFPSSDSLSESAEYEAFSYLTKPVNREEIVQVVTEAIGKGKSKREGRRKNYTADFALHS